jgi:uncharacterized protein (TIGR02996 family)
MADQLQLEKAILARPNDPSVYAVYGDWLQAQGDPRGELVSVQAALASTRDTKRFMELKQTESRLLAKVTEQLATNGKAVNLTWRFGFVHQLELLDESLSLKSLLQHPALRFVQGIRLAVPVDDQSAILEELIASAPPLLNRLELHRGAFHNLRAFQKAFPALEHLVIDRIAIEGFDPSVLLAWTELRTLELTTITSEALATTLQTAPWKKLRRVFLRVHGTAQHAVLIDHLAPVLALPELKHIGVTMFVDGVMRTISARPNLSTLQELTLFDFCTDARLAPLLQRKEALRGLKLVIHDGEISQETERNLRKAVKGLALGAVTVYAQDEAGVHEMDDDEARNWRERQEKLEKQSDYNHDDWN